MALTRWDDLKFAQEYLIDCDAKNAATRLGLRSPNFAGPALLRRTAVQRCIAELMDQRRIRLEIDADFVLAELVRQYLRLKGLLGHDLSEVTDAEGKIMSIQAWPEVWRRSLVTEYVSAAFQRSHDGEQKENSPSWDTIGQKVKVKRERVLEIEREIRATLKLIGEHMKVKAFPVPGEKMADALQDLAYTFRWKSSPNEQIVDVPAKELKP
jgi:hypothetical protein